MKKETIMVKTDKYNKLKIINIKTSSFLRSSSFTKVCLRTI